MNDNQSFEEETRSSWAIFPNKFPKRKTWTLEDPYTWHQDDDEDD